MKLKILLMPIIISLFCIYPAKIFAGIARNELNARRAIAMHFCNRTHRLHPFNLCQLGRQAYNVSSCETGRTWNVWAQNGQYLGIFQMGSHERQLFGYGNNAWDQARGARNYYNYEVRHGSYGWTPWSCRAY